MSPSTLIRYVKDDIAKGLKIVVIITTSFPTLLDFVSPEALICYIALAWTHAILDCYTCVSPVFAWSVISPSLFWDDIIIFERLWME